MIHPKHQKSTDNFVPPPGATPAPDEASLRFLYAGRIPPAIDLTRPDNSGRIDLEAYISPFKGTRRGLKEKFGQDYSEPCDEWLEKQINKFCKIIIKLHWNRKAKDKPESGFQIVVGRACRAGVMYRCGFHPKSPGQLEAERVEQERLETERCERARKEAEEYERKAEQIRKDKELVKRISKEPDVMEYLYLAGVYPGEGRIKEEHVRDIKLALRALRERYPEEEIVSVCKKERHRLELELYG